MVSDRWLNPAGANGLIFGNFHQLYIQALGVLATVAYSFVATFAIYKFVDILMGVRVSESEELLGLDLAQHREGAYTILE